MKAEIKKAGKSASKILVDRLMFKSPSQSRKAFGGMDPTTYFRKLRDSRSSKKTF